LSKDGYIAGQRWISETEPELGLGIVLEASDRDVSIHFPASEETRRYAAESAPLRRVAFAIGDRVSGEDVDDFTVTAVSTTPEGLLRYHGDTVTLDETQLSNEISFHKPEDRLAGGRFDDTRVFDLRYASLRHQHRIRQHAVRGLVGARMELIHHQLYIARQVADRYAPRVLLADEVGLGKTIEAGLIMHTLVHNGRVGRVLIVVPDALVHQWFVEMLRRFNLRFSILDSAYVDMTDDPNESNPFAGSQLVLCSVSFLCGKPKHAQLALEAGWDLMVIDEAHHLAWAPGNPSAEYCMIEKLAQTINGLLLLTATPEQLGEAGHFARLRLLDPDRFHDLKVYHAEAEGYHDVAGIISRLQESTTVSDQDRVKLLEFSGDDADAVSERLESLTPESRDALINTLVDHHGTGRVMFRNTRQAISGFPKRLGIPVPIPPPDTLATVFKRNSNGASSQEQMELALRPPDTWFSDARAWWDQDPRVDWLLDLLKQTAPNKILLICKHKQAVVALGQMLRQRANTKVSLFHEDLELITRDRNAAYFAEPDGARILLCSEIGSEGRNFQFAHILVLFDLPTHPELLEQRIGRLDRIGQKRDIRIYVPYLEGTAQEVLCKWHEALGALDGPVRGGNLLYSQLGDRVLETSLAVQTNARGATGQLDRLLADSRDAAAQIAKRLQAGRDQLIERNSFNREASEQLVRQIEELESDLEIETYMNTIFEHFGVSVEDLAPHCYVLTPSVNYLTDAFPGLPDSGLSVTFRRQKALARDDLAFLTWDHPMVIGSMDLLLGGEHGNCSYAVWPSNGGRAVLIEVIYVLECLAPLSLQADRFLPPTPIRLVVNHHGKDVTETHPARELSRRLEAARDPLNRQVTQTLLPNMLALAGSTAATHMQTIRDEASATMTAQLTTEAQRLRDLQRRNPNVRSIEIEQLEAEEAQLRDHIQNARLRLDAIRVIWKG
jgi:ATP-dependent helicase HepA